METNLTPVRSKVVKAPSVHESPVNIECEVKQIIPLGTHDMFLAEVKAIQVDNSLIDKKTGELQLYRARLVTYSHGHYYNLGKILGKFGYSVQKNKKQ